jgi:hypothetical protein
MTLFPVNSETLISPFVCDPPVNDWLALIRRRPNVLISGPPHATDAFVRALTPSLRLPICRVACGTLQSLPEAGGTLILDDVGSLDSEQQQAFNSWFGESWQTAPQVISIAPTALYPHVQAGTFLDALYYRLNVMYFEISPEIRPAGDL